MNIQIDMLLPSADALMNILLFVIMFLGFVFIVLRSAKYQYIADYIVNKLARWF